MKEKIIELSKQIRQFDPQNKQQLEEFKIKFLSKKGMIPSLFQEFKQVPPEER